MHLAHVEPAQIANGDFLRTAIKFANTERRDSEFILHTVAVMRTLFGETGFTEMHIAPRHAADQRELTAGHRLRFILADAEVLRQPEQQL